MLNANQRNSAVGATMMHQVWTIGHSTRELGELLEILSSQQIEAIADVRRFPGSRRYPQFGREVLQAALQDAGVAYQHFPELGGRRTSKLEDSPNAAWRVAAFRAYADYMLTPEFATAFTELVALAQRRRTAIMCAEVLPWRCHRRLLADKFLTRGWQVLDIMAIGQARPHELPPFAQVNGDQLTYPGEPG
jgi:uncharacterized protein (DUF488 family)